MNDIVISERNGAVLSIELNRPDHGNRMTMSMIDDVAAALKKPGSSVKLVVISSAGNDFCLGRDYQAAPELASQGRSTPSATQIRERMTAPIIDLYSAIRALPVPSVSIVQGDAQGFGCALACACDIVLAAQSAKFSLPEMGERRLPPTLAMSALWNRVHTRALTYLVFSTREISAQEALHAGLISVALPDEQLQAHAQGLIGEITAQPKDALSAVVEYLRLAPGLPDRARASLGEQLFSAVLSSR